MAIIHQVYSHILINPLLNTECKVFLREEFFLAFFAGSKFVFGAGEGHLTRVLLILQQLLERVQLILAGPERLNKALINNNVAYVYGSIQVLYSITVS